MYVSINLFKIYQSRKKPTHFKVEKIPSKEKEHTNRPTETKQHHHRYSFTRERITIDKDILTQSTKTIFCIDLHKINQPDESKMQT